jgi:hypothetical protein
MTVLPVGPGELPLPLVIQISGAIAGGLVGGCAGFIANNLLQTTLRRRTRRNVASALTGEIDALCRQIEDQYLPLLRASLESAAAGRPVYHHFRGDREYAPIFRSLGFNIGLLPDPLPCELAAWYGGLTVCLERAHELHDLFKQCPVDLIPYLREIADVQREALTGLVEAAKPLTNRLGGF